MRLLARDRVLHFHQDKSDDCNQQEARKRKQKDTADRKHGGRQHHQKRKHREHVVVARPLQREEPDDHRKEYNVNGCR